MVFYRACGARVFLVPQPRLAGRSVLHVELDNSMLRTAAYMSYSTKFLACFIYFFLPSQVAKVPEIAGWDHLYHGTFVGIACDNNADVRLEWPNIHGWRLVDVCFVSC